MILLASLSVPGCTTPDLDALAPSDTHSIRTTGRDDGIVRFVALGDTGKGTDTQREVAEGVRAVCARRGCDFALLLGDNLYPDGMDHPEDPRMDAVFTDVYGDLGLDFQAVLGNHDYGRRHVAARGAHQIAWAQTRERFHLPAPYYRFEVGRAAFWALDTDAVFWTGVQPQGGWLDETLGPSEARWKVVFGHHPYKSDGKHGNAGAYEGWSGVPYSSGSAVRTLFVDHVVGRADLVLAGHDHNLQVLESDGSVLVVSGAGASARPIVDRGNHPILAHGVPGFAWVELADRMTVALHGADGSLLGEHVVPSPLAR